jgi:hypothetical protein
VKPALSVKRVGLLSVLVAAILLLVPLAAGSGSGYSLSYTRAASGTNANVDLVSLSTSVYGSTQISVTFQVSGSIDLSSSTVEYWAFFGGGGESNATAYVWFSNSLTNGTYVSAASNAYGYGPEPFTLGNGGSSLTFYINQSAVGPASSFSANAWAVSGNSVSGTWSWIGTDYQGGGTATCAGATCTSTSTQSSTSSTVPAWEWIAIGLVVIVVIAVVVVVVVVLPKRRAPPPAQPPMAAGGMMPPPMPPAPGSPPPTP